MKPRARTIARRSAGPRRRATLAVLMAAAVAGPANAAQPAAKGSPPGPADRWYVVSVDGRRAGTLHRSVRRRDGRDVWREEMTIAVRRLGTATRLRSVVEVEHGPDGRPVRARAELGESSAARSAVCVWGEGGLEVRTGGPGVTGEPVVRPLPEGGAADPWAAAESLERQRREGGDEVSVNPLDVFTGRPAGEERFRLAGRVVLPLRAGPTPVTRWERVGPGRARHVVFADAAGVEVRTERDAWLPVVIELADEVAARAPFDPPEMMAGTLVVPDAAIARPRETRRAVYTLRSETGPGVPPPAGGVQTVAGGRDGAVRVVVDLDARPEGPAPGAEPADLAPSPLVECGDPAVVALLDRAYGAGRPSDAAARAERLRAFVFAFVRDKTMGVGSASAAETARSRRGDCTEHAVLLMALLRADGVPARAVTGLAYTEAAKGGRGAFGFHMWVRALVGEDGTRRWVDLDPTLSPTRAFDAAHIALATDPLADGRPFAGLGGPANDLRIRVESAE